MGVQDVITKKYMERNDIFAALFNYYVYDGKKVVCKENLLDADSAESILLPTAKGKQGVVKRYRDILKQCVLKFAGDIGYLLIGIENQSEVHYAMPVRNMLYDGLAYTRQISAIRLKNQRAGNMQGGAEFLSGLSKRDKLIPVVTLVVYWGQESWDAPCSLHEMLADTDAKVLSCINDYRINLVNPHQMVNKDFEKLGEGLSVVMRFMKASADEKEMRKLLQEFKEEYSGIEEDAAEVIRACARVDIVVNEKGKVVDVCKAWDDHWESGRKAGMECGKSRQIIASVTALRESLKISLEEACEMLKIKLTEYERALKVVDGQGV